MRMIVDKKKSIALIIILVTIVVIIFCGRYYFAHNKSYKNEAIEKGDYIRYTHASCHSYVVMDIGGKILVVNGVDESETKKIYDTLREKCQMN